MRMRSHTFAGGFVAKETAPLRQAYGCAAHGPLGNYINVHQPPKRMGVLYPAANTLGLRNRHIYHKEPLEPCHKVPDFLIKHVPFKCLLNGLGTIGANSKGPVVPFYRAWQNNRKAN